MALGLLIGKQMQELDSMRVIMGMGIPLSLLVNRERCLRRHGLGPSHRLRGIILPDFGHTR